MVNAEVVGEAVHKNRLESAVNDLIFCLEIFKNQGMANIESRRQFAGVEIRPLIDQQNNRRR
jgi:hypothetical protein